MGKRGPKPGTTGANVKKLQAPIPSDCELIPPEWLDQQAKDRWNMIVPELKKLGTVAAIDTNMLTRYCRMYSQWLDCQATMLINGVTQHVHSSQGDYDKECTEFSVADRLNTAMLKIENVMGMNAHSRKGLVQSEPAKKADNPFDVLKIMTG